MHGYIDGTGQVVNVHEGDQCAGRDCVIHNPSTHHMNGWPTHWRGDRGLMERICKHGVGHPDPDHMSHIKRLHDAGLTHEPDGMHGCDGCCNPNKAFAK